MLSWILFAVIGYFLTAIASILDKFIVSQRIGQPATYAFLVSAFSLVACIFMPFGFHGVSFLLGGVFLCSGIAFSWSLFFLYSSFRYGDVSVMVPLAGVFSAVTALVPSLVWSFSSGDFPVIGIVSFCLLLLGTGLIVFSELTKRSFALRSMWAPFLSGLLLTTYFFLLKIGEFSGLSAINAFIWSRIGIACGGLSFLLFPLFRKDILQRFSFVTFFKRSVLTIGKFSLNHVSTRIPTSILFLSGKTLGGLGSALLVLAAYNQWASIAIIQALIGVQFGFVAIFALILSIRFPRVFSEQLSSSTWIYKGIGFVFVSFGVWSAFHGGSKLF